MTVTDIATTREERALTLSSAALSIQDVAAQKQLIAQVMGELMHDGEHYGKIPGAAKPSLWKPGADLIGFVFRLSADYVHEEVVHEPQYIYYRTKCILTHIPTGKCVGTGVGSCNSREEKYRRAAPKKCPKCSKETIIKGREEYGGGWLCFAKKGGCGEKWKDGDAVIEGQDTGIADPSDLDNTILKMSLKRSRIDAILTATAAGDFFGQDLEDLSERVRRLFNLGDVTIPDDGGAEDREAIRAAVAQEAPQSRPKGATQEKGPTTSVGPNTTRPANDASGPADGDTATPAGGKPARAPSIRHNGKFASDAQVKKLHVLRGEAGIPDCKGDCVKETQKYMKSRGGLVPAVVRCAYHTQLAAFHDQNDKPITTSTHLSMAQISNLIGRYEAQIQKQGARAAELPDMGALGGVKNSDDGPTAKGSFEADDPFSEVRGAIDGKEDPEACLNELCDVFRIPTLADLPQHEAPAALALVLAWGTKSYPTVLERVRP